MPAVPTATKKAPEPGLVFAGCLAVVGGLGAGLVLSLVLFFAAGLGSRFASHAEVKIVTLAIIAIGVVGIVLLATSGKKRDGILQVFLVTTLIAALGVFSTCSALLWGSAG